MHWCRKQEDAVFLLHSTQGNTPHNCCQIAAKLNNSIIPHSGGGLATFVSNNQISEEARRVVLSETLSSCIARRLFSLETILLIKRGVTAEQRSEEHRLLVLFVCSLFKVWSKTVVASLRGACGLLLSQLACLREHEILRTDSAERDAACGYGTTLGTHLLYACGVGLHENYLLSSLFASPRPCAK